NGNLLFELPFGAGRRWGAGMSPIANHILGGWDISAIIQATSGRPFNFVNNRYNHHFFGRSIPYLTKPIDYQLIKEGGDVFYIGPDEDTRREIANEYFENVYPGSRIARNQGLYGPGYWNVDMSVSKIIQFTEGVRGTLRVESFNAFN